MMKAEFLQLPELEAGSFDGSLMAPPPSLFDGRNLSTASFTGDYLLELEDAYEVCIIATAKANGGTKVK